MNKQQFNEVKSRATDSSGEKAQRQNWWMTALKLRTNRIIQ
jgi:hypothetical protein